MAYIDGHHFFPTWKKRWGHPAGYAMVQSASSGKPQRNVDRCSTGMYSYNITVWHLHNQILIHLWKHDHRRRDRVSFNHSMQTNRLIPKGLNPSICCGMVMVIAALDHVRDYFAWPLTRRIHWHRFVQHSALFHPMDYALLCADSYCSPVLPFICRVFARPKKNLAFFYFEARPLAHSGRVDVVAFAWTFNPFFNIFPFQVIWAIGISMVILGVLLLLNFFLHRAVDHRKHHCAGT